MLISSPPNNVYKTGSKIPNKGGQLVAPIHQAMLAKLLRKLYKNKKITLPLRGQRLYIHKRWRKQDKENRKPSKAKKSKGIIIAKKVITISQSYGSLYIVVTTGIIVVSSDPVCDPEDIPGTIEEMIDTIEDIPRLPAPVTSPSPDQPSTTTDEPPNDHPPEEPSNISESGK